MTIKKKDLFLLVGWDGATFDIIEPLIEEGRLPNIAALIDGGVHGRMDSTIPPLTPIAWTSISTGVNPGKHGIFDAMLYDSQNRRLNFVNASMRKVKPFWKILSDRGVSSGVINVPMTYPPDDIKGFVVSGMFTPQGVSDFTSPPNLLNDLEQRLGKYMLECKREKNPAKYLELILQMTKYRTDIALYLMDQYEDLSFLFVAFMASDRVQHFFWKYLDPSHPEHDKYGDAIAKVYEGLDRSLGRLLDKLSPENHVMMVSDHGAGELKTAFFLNNWLLKSGYLVLKEGLSDVYSQNKSSRIGSLLSKSIKKMVPSVMRDKTKPDGKANEEINHFFSRIDWKRTKAFSEGVAGGIYINYENIDSSEYEFLVNDISTGLMLVSDKEGNKVVEKVHKKGDIFGGNHDLEPLDLTVICKRGYQVIAPNELLFHNKKYEEDLFFPHKWSGRHEKDGIFLLNGPGIKKGIKLNGCEIIDVAPTLLYLMKESIPDYMDGKVLESAILEEYLHSHGRNFSSDVGLDEGAAKTLTQDEESQLADRLKDLGYIE